MGLSEVLKGLGQFIWRTTPFGFGQWLEKKASGTIPVKQEPKKEIQKTTAPKVKKVERKTVKKTEAPEIKIEEPKKEEKEEKKEEAKSIIKEFSEKLLKTYEILEKQLPVEESRLRELQTKTTSDYDKISAALKEIPKLDLKDFVYPTIPEKIDSYQKLSGHAKLLIGLLTCAFAVKGIKEHIPNAAATYFNSVIEAYRKKDEDEYQKALDKYREELQRLNWEFQKRIAEYQQKFHEWQMTRYEPLKLELERDQMEYQNALAGYQMTLQAMQHIETNLINLIGKEMQAEDLQRKWLETLAKIEEIYKGRIPREQAMTEYYRKRAREVGKGTTITLPESVTKEIEKRITEEEEE